MERLTIVIDEILVNLDRQEGGMGEIDSLAASIDRNGLINPITVVELYNSSQGLQPGEERYEIVAGRRRLDAAKSLGWTEIPATVLARDEAIEEEVQLAENVNRLDMHPLDEAVLYKKLTDGGTELAEVAKLAGRSKSAVYQRMGLLRLIKPMRERYRVDQFTLTQASMIGELPEESQKAFNEYLEKEKNAIWDGRITSWAMTEALRKFAGTRLPAKPFALCASCLTRTRYGDASLFPELAGEKDRCLNRDCYVEQYAEWIRLEIKKHYAENQVNFSDIAEAPEILEDERIGLLSPNPEAHLVIEGVTFPIVSDRMLKTCDLIDFEHYGEWVDKAQERGTLKTGFYVTEDGTLVVKMVRYTTYKEYQEIIRDGQDDDDDDPVIECVQLESDDEKKAYREVMKSRWHIDRTVTESVLKQIALEHFGGQVSPPIFHDMVSVLSRSALVYLAQAKGSTASDEEIANGHQWLDGAGLEWMKTFAFDVLLMKSITTCYIDLDAPMNEDTVKYFADLGEDPEAVSERFQKARRDEIQRRMTAILNGEAVPDEDDDDDFEDDYQEEGEDFEGDNYDDGGEDNTPAEANAEEEATEERGAASAETFSEEAETPSLGN